MQEPMAAQRPQSMVFVNGQPLQQVNGGVCAANMTLKKSIVLFFI